MTVNTQLVEILLREGATVGTTLATIFIALRFLIPVSADAIKLARQTADDARTELAEIKKEVANLRTELEECKRDSIHNLKLYQEKLMEVEQEAHSARLDKQGLLSRVSILETQVRGAM